MNKNERKAKIYKEDTLRRNGDNVLGVVIRTWHDIEQNDDIDDVTLSPGEFEVNWHDNFGACGDRKLEGHDLQILHEDDSDCVVVDRSFGIGDAVKKDSAATMSGIVQSGDSRLKIRNFATREIKDCAGLDVVAESERYQEGDFVVLDEWVGIIKSLRRKTIVRMSGGEFIFCEEEEIHPVQYDEGNIFYPDLLPCTTIVEVNKLYLKYATYLRGKYSKGMSTHGTVCISTPFDLSIDWQFQNPMVANFVSKACPSKHIRLTKSIALRTAKLVDAQFTHQIGDFVRPLDGPLKGNLYNAGKERFLLDSEQDMKQACLDWEIVSTEQFVTVKWQDGTCERHRAADLVPYQNVDDLELWPADHIVSKNDGQKGVVQTCDAKERIATVSWNASDAEAQTESLYELMNDAHFDIDLGDLVLIIPEDGNVAQIPESDSWGASALLHSVSTTISRYIPGITPSLGTNGPESSKDIIDWLGQLVEVNTDGSCLVSLCFNEEATRINVPVTRLVHVASTGDDDDEDSGSESDSELTVMSTDSDSSAYSGASAEDDSEEESGIWTNEDGQPLVDATDGDEWEDANSDTNMSDDTSDEEMIDVVGEQVAQPERADIILDVVPDSRSTTINNGPNSNPESNPPEHTPVVADRSTEVADAALPVTVAADSFPSSATDFAPFLVLDSEPTDHAFINEPLNRSQEAMKRVVQEYKALQNSLPSGILVRAYESRMDLLRVIILGVPGTPYVYAPMLFDIYLPASFPYEPPFVHFHSWTNGVGKINPNLYEEGKVCLSLLGTWHGSSSESWTIRSSLLQIFVSLQALVLVREPYYNEAGYEVLSASDTAVAANNYSERAFVLTRGFISHVLRNPVLGLEDEMTWLYTGPGGFLHLALQQAKRVASDSTTEGIPATMTRDPAGHQEEESTSSVTRVSKGALVLLNRIIKDLAVLASGAPGATP